MIHNDPVPEVEMWAMASRAGATIHTARFQTPRPTGTEFVGVAVGELLRATGLASSISQLTDLGVDAMGYCFTSSSVFGGLEFDREFAERAGELAGCPVVTAGAALLAELEGTSTDEMAILVPPWFSSSTIAALIRYIAPGMGCPPEIVQFELPSEWDDIERPDLFDRGARHAIDPLEVIRQVLESLSESRTTIVVPGSGFASAKAVDQLTTRFGRRVVTANSALFDVLLHRAQERDRPDLQRKPQAAATTSST